jgi:hypothetical protein
VCHPVRPYPLRMVAVEDFSPTLAPRSISPPPFLYRRSVPFRRRPPPSRHRPPTCSVDTTPMAAYAPTIFLSREPPTSTTGRCPHRSILLPLLRLRRARHTGAPKGAWSHHRASALPTPTPFTGESLAPHAAGGYVPLHWSFLHRTGSTGGRHMPEPPVLPVSP